MYHLTIPTTHIKYTKAQFASFVLSAGGGCKSDSTLPLRFGSDRRSQSIYSLHMKRKQISNCYYFCVVIVAYCITILLAAFTWPIKMHDTVLNLRQERLRSVPSSHNLNSVCPPPPRSDMSVEIVQCDLEPLILFVGRRRSKLVLASVCPTNNCEWWR